MPNGFAGLPVGTAPAHSVLAADACALAVLGGEDVGMAGLSAAPAQTVVEFPFWTE